MSEQPREAGEYRCDECRITVGWHQMLIRNGVRENCPACLPGRAIVGTMKRVDRAAPQSTAQTAQEE